MTPELTLTIDGVQVAARPGQTILEAADDAGIYIPRLCSMKGLTPFGACRVCTVSVGGRFQSACTQPAADGLLIDNDTPKLNGYRKAIVEMLFVEGNHYCMFCEKSGNCELQALAYRLGMTAPRYPYLFPQRPVDATHPGVIIDHNRCILCARCVRASRELDHKNVFQFVGRGAHKHVGVDAAGGLGHTSLQDSDKAAEACPVGAILKKGAAFHTPIGQRHFDTVPIGSDIEPTKTMDDRRREIA